MRKLGLIGGLSWYSTELYYARINRQVLLRTNGSCNAPLLIESLNFCDVGKATTSEDWNHVADVLIASARRLEQAGATALLICANSCTKCSTRLQLLSLFRSSTLPIPSGKR